MSLTAATSTMFRMVNLTDGESLDGLVLCHCARAVGGAHESGRSLQQNSQALGPHEERSLGLGRVVIVVVVVAVVVVVVVVVICSLLADRNEMKNKQTMGVVSG